jgi:hypothetical protein
MLSMMKALKKSELKRSMHQHKKYEVEVEPSI